MKYLFLLILILSASPALAQVGYTPLEPLPFVSNNSGTVDINTFLPGVVRLAIALAGGLAVIRIMIGGIQYMTSEAWGQKNDAKATITNALLGLILAIAAAGILALINPDLLNLKLGISSLEGTRSSLGDGLGSAPGQSTPEEAGCPNCEPVYASDIAMKPPGQACDNYQCYLDPSLIAKLKELKKLTDAAGVSWQITEAFPPTVPHKDDCHKPNNSQTGKCADIALTGDTSFATIRKFFDALSQLGFRYAYEVKCSTQRLIDLKAAKEFTTAQKSSITCYDTTTGEHAHVEI